MAAYPSPRSHFQLEGVGERVGFTEVTGLDMQVDVIEYREGSSPEFSKIKMPGLKKFSNVVLKRGVIAGNTDFYKWMKTVNLNTIERRDITIKLLNEKHEAVLAWKLTNAFPIKVQASDLKADANEVAIETMELAHEGLSLIDL